MLTDGASISVAAGSTSNVFAGRPIEFIGSASSAQLWLVSDAAGQTCALLVNVGGTQLAPIASGTTVNVAIGAGQGPRFQEDLMQDGIPLPSGARSQLNITNTGAAAVVSRYRAVIRP